MCVCVPVASSFRDVPLDGGAIKKNASPGVLSRRVAPNLTQLLRVLSFSILTVPVAVANRDKCVNVRLS